MSTEGELFYRIKKKKISNVSNIKIFDNLDNEVYNTLYRPFKFKGRYNILDQTKEKIAVINTSIRYIYELLYKDIHYIIKGSVWKNQFSLYQYDDVIGSIKVKKILRKRYFEIELKDKEDKLLAIVLLLIAQAIRERS